MPCGFLIWSLRSAEEWKFCKSFHKIGSKSGPWTLCSLGPHLNNNILLWPVSHPEYLLPSLSSAWNLSRVVYYHSSFADIFCHCVLRGSVKLWPAEFQFCWLSWLAALAVVDKPELVHNLRRIYCIGQGQSGRQADKVLCCMLRGSSSSLPRGEAAAGYIHTRKFTSLMYRECTSSSVVG